MNPLTLQTGPAAKVLQSDLLRSGPPKPRGSKAEGVAELDALAADGTISSAERGPARGRVLAE